MVVAIPDLRVSQRSGMRILVMLLLDTLPMLGNVLLLCFFVFFIFGIIGVQLWEGILRQRCFLKPIPNVTYPNFLALGALALADVSAFERLQPCDSPFPASPLGNALVY
ncbi:hypothetical protein J6590_029004 [Homalodisca vitripennis]|nr:hypothetical protein J6590_029004 [Homalodisca vitripennis]